MPCSICEKRKAERFCPAKGEKICAVCCGTEREVTIDCPSDCFHLVAAHRYEDGHQRSLPVDTPLLDEKIPQDLVYTHQQLMAALAFSIAKFCAVQPATVDADVLAAIHALAQTYKTLSSGIIYEKPPDAPPDVLAAIHALAQTYKTLSSGIIYEKPPDAPLPRELYAALIAFISEVKKQQSERAASAGLNDSELFHLLVFLYRMGLLRTNGRPRARRFIEFLRGQFPQSPELKREESRIIVP